MSCSDSGNKGSKVNPSLDNLMATLSQAACSGSFQDLFCKRKHVSSLITFFSFSRPLNTICSFFHVYIRSHLKICNDYL